MESRNLSNSLYSFLQSISKKCLKKSQKIFKKCNCVFFFRFAVNCICIDYVEEIVIVWFFPIVYICVCECMCVSVLYFPSPTIPFPNYNNDYKIYLYLCVSFSCFLPIFLMIICFSVVVFSVRMFLTYLISADISRPHQNEIYSGKKPLARPSQHTQSSVHPSQPQKH